MATRRRGAGEGAVYKRKDTGLWVGTVELGRNSLGHWRRKEVKARTKREALDKLDKARTAQRAGIPATDGRVTVDALLDWWLDHVKAVCTFSTWEGYERRCRLYVRPLLGKRPVAKVTPLDVQALLDGMAARDCGAENARHTHATLRAALSWGERMGVVSRNVAKLAAPGQVRWRKVEPLTMDEANALIGAAGRHRFGPLYVTMLTLGLRPREALALTWADVDLDGPVLAMRIDKALIKREGGYEIGPTKTDKSERRLPTPPMLARVLRDHRRAQAVERLAPVPSGPTRVSSSRTPQVAPGTRPWCRPSSGGTRRSQVFAASACTTSASRPPRSSSPKACRPGS